MQFTLESYLLGFAAALLVGLSKTGVPGVNLPAIVLMTRAFAGNEKLSVVAILPLLLVGDSFSVAFYRQHTEWRRLWGLFPYVAAGMIPGAVVLGLADDYQFKQLLGWLVLGLLALEVARQRFAWRDLPHRWWFSALMGALAGFTTMVGNAAGPIMGIYLISRGMGKEQFMGLWSWFFLIVNLAKLPILVTMKFAWDVDLLVPVSPAFVAALLPMVAVGALVGRHLFDFISQRYFDPLVLGLAGIAAVRLLTA